ncbi:hypothetical protein WAE56_17615 [Iodobacter sp. LRB]|uniref:hypothetical protein n=1 Tax=unclassified Iodobacter TaxID=235634 RepID=UPI0015D51F21|nr:hypothetical protein [Iodobacter sp. BJB302]
MHDSFDSSAALKSLLARIGHQVAEVVDYQQLLEQEIDRLSDALDQAIDWEKAKQAGLK